jgi:adenylate kinase family enzyme
VLLRETPRRVHVIGGMASGKTTVGRQVGQYLGAPLYELDKVAYVAGVQQPADARRAEAARIAASPTWVTEGVYLGWIEPILKEANIIVWLDVSWTVAAWRIVRRHVQQSIAGTNKHGGFRRLWRFLGAAHDYYIHQQYPASSDDDGGLSRAATERALAPYLAKVLVCRDLARGQSPLH